MYKKKCNQCKQFFKALYKRNKYCSRRCYYKSKKGKIPHPITEAMKKKISIANTGRKHTDEEKIKMSLALIGKPGRHTGHTHSEKTKKYWSKIRKGKHYSPATEFKKGQNLGEKHPHWKGGRIVDDYGYIQIKTHTHPYRGAGNYIREHRLVIEAQIGRYLKREEASHHLGKKNDNRPQMLMAFINQSAHRRFHKNPKNVKPQEIIFDGRKLTI